MTKAKAPTQQNQVKSGNLYDYPKYYDLVFGSDWKAEFDFLLAVFERFATGKVRRVFEPACGTGRLLFRLGRAGFEVLGLDLNPRAVDYCNRRLLKHGLPASVFVGDMSDFQLPRKIDAAFNMINSFRHLPTEAQATAHLQCVSRALRKGGLYVLGLHLTPTEGDAMTEERWSAQRGFLCINTHLATSDHNEKQRMERCTMTLDVYSPTQRMQIVDELSFRTYTKDQMAKLLRTVPELEIVETFDFRYNLAIPIPLNQLTQDVVYILRKR